MKHTIPSSKIWRQPNIDDYSGELYATKAVDLTSARGRVRPSRSTIVTKSTSDDSDLKHPACFVRTDADNTQEKWWALCNTVLFKTTSAATTDWTQDAITGSPTNLSNSYSDMVLFNGSLIVSSQIDMYKLTAGTWTANWWTGAGNLNQSNLNNSSYHPLYVGFNNLLLVGDNNKIHTIDINNKVRNGRLIFKSDYKVRWITGNSTTYFIGADNIHGGTGRVFEWDGSSENFTREFDIQSDISFSCAVKQEIPYVFNRNGQLLRYTGGSFAEVARLPITHTVYDTYTDTYNSNLNDGSSLNVRVHGMDIIDGNVHILLNGSMNNGTTSLLDTMFSGIYEYDDSIGLYNKYSLSRYVSGARVDFGGGSIFQAGALKNINDHSFFAGLSTYSDIATTEYHAILTINTIIENRGYIITPKIQTPGELQKWQRVWLKHRLKNSGGSIANKLLVKYRTSDSITSNFKAPVTWVNTTSFTSIGGTSNCIGDGDWSTAVTGDEITIMRGHGAGVVAHIVSITNNSGTYTIVIDETLEASATTTANVYVRNWKKLGEVLHTDLNPKDFALYPTPSSWIQFKIELRGYLDGCELEEIQVISEPHNTNLS